MMLRTKAPSGRGLSALPTGGESSVPQYREIHKLPGNFGQYLHYRYAVHEVPYFLTPQYASHPLSSVPHDSVRHHPVQQPDLPLRRRNLQYSFQSLSGAENARDTDAEIHTIVFSPMVSYFYAVPLPVGYLLYYTAAFSPSAPAGHLPHRGRLGALQRLLCVKLRRSSLSLT